jgi:hypothetical protein
MNELANERRDSAGENDDLLVFAAVHMQRQSGSPGLF